MEDKAKKTYYVAIGASAGGLEAISAFFKHMPIDSGMIFIVIQHLSPDYKSMMDELLAKVTPIPVEVVKDGTEPVPNHIYLIPPRTNMTIFHGRLLLEPQDRSTSMLNLPIDVFFHSLAEDQGANAIAVVLSGTGSDGTRGCRSIKEEGGLVVVQSETSTKFGGMPKSVIVNGLADFVMAAEELPTQLLKYINHSLVELLTDRVAVTEEKSALARIFSMLRSRTKIDFTFYKPPTILRRIQRRMSITQVQTMDDYVEFMQRVPEEQSTLYRELLIGVTCFFRDADVFDALMDKHLKGYLEKTDRTELRFWIAGCSTGEEAYTYCIMFREICEQLNLNIDLKIFATDIDQDALNRASIGLYPDSIAADVSHLMLSKYFVRKEEGYQISHHIREMVVFARHDLIKDPPFTNIDLVSCRNLLIYLKNQSQQRIIDAFNFSLRPGGLLVLGSSESLGDAEAYFDVLDHKWKIFGSRGNRKPLLNSERFSTPDPNFYQRDYSSVSRRGNEVNIDDARALESFVDNVIAEFIPFSMIVNENNELVRAMGDSQRYLKPISGRMTADLGKLLDKELSVPVLTGLSKVFKSRTEVSFSNVRVKYSGETSKVNILIKPMEVRRNSPVLAAVVITHGDKGVSPVLKEGNYDADIGIMQRISDLEQELQFTRENLQATIEELETSNEELQATNEELLSSNEELQSTNEELQSVNEELFTVNSEYQGKIAEMGELSADLQNFMAATQTMVVFVNMEGILRRFTENCKTVFNILQHDIGRPLAHVSHHLVNIDLAACVKEIIEHGKITDVEVKTDAGDWYHVRFMPYLLGQHHQGGVIIALHEINQLYALREKCMSCEVGRSIIIERPLC